MNNLNPIHKKSTKEERKVLLQEQTKILAEFFNGIVIEIEEEYKYDS